MHEKFRILARSRNIDDGGVIRKRAARKTTVGEKVVFRAVNRSGFRRVREHSASRSHELSPAEFSALRRSRS